MSSEFNLIQNKIWLALASDGCMFSKLANLTRHHWARHYDLKASKSESSATMAPMSEEGLFSKTHNSFVVTSRDMLAGWQLYNRWLVDHLCCSIVKSSIVGAPGGYHRLLHAVHLKSNH